ncbi:flavodoxin family protein, partial [Clostridiaceae bacterium HSG29]|nr:flavodoxin family protein [Clostridiaceae bacterium HSG29]
FDILVVGYWVNKGTANIKIQNFLEKIANKKIAIFGTSGQYPDSARAIKYMNRVKNLVEKKNEYLGGYICQGKIKSERTEKRLKILKGNSHYLDELGYKRHLESRNHPNEIDIDNAIIWIENIIKLNKNIC